LVDPISPTGSVSNTVPHTWATTDVCAISIIYERA
jgi:hypothetical protein